jgi:hypothetical protein
MRTRTTLAALLTLASVHGLAQAQANLRPGGIRPVTQPTFSPYLNIVRPGASTAVNYFGIVRPELAFRGSIGQLQTDVDTNRQLITTGRDAAGGPAGLTTGHASVFLNTGGYFLNSTGGAAGRVGPGGGQPAGAVIVGGMGRGGAGAPKGRGR